MLFIDERATTGVGQVTSGTYAPSVRGPVAMGYVSRDLTDSGTRLFAEVRGQRTPVVVANMPFVPHRYHR